MKARDPRELVGKTPNLIFQTEEAPHCAFWIKLEGCNPSGSVKDRACIANLAQAVATKSLTKSTRILDASSGNMACSLAYFGRLMGYGVTLVCSSKLTSDKANFIRFYEADLILHGDFTIEGNLLCQRMAKESPDKYCFLDQLHNWSNPKAHYDTTAVELIEDFPDLTAVVGSLGSGGTMVGIGQRMKEVRPKTLIFTVEAASGTKIPGTGAFDDGDYVTPFIAKALVNNLFDARCKITLARAQARARDAAHQGIFVGFQTGGVIEAAVRLALEHKLRGDIAIISGDSGWKNMETLMKVEPLR